MPNESARTVLIAIGADLGVALAKVCTAVFTGSPVVAASASDSLADTANDLILLLAQRRSLPADDQHALGYGRDAYFWALFAGLGVFVGGAVFSLREGIDELIHPSVTSSFAVAYVVFAVSAGFALVSVRHSAGEMTRRARLFHRELLAESEATSDPMLQAVFLSDAVSITGNLITGCFGP
jgi:divalent metal cation (Fe/Co/Zn/Cd) transporter